MVRVQVQVSHLAIDLDGENTIFKRGDIFEIPMDRAIKLHNSITILDEPPVIAEPEPNPPDIEEATTTPTPTKTTPKRRR